MNQTMKREIGLQTGIAVVLLAIVLAFGTYVRMADLGAGDFGVDELYQVYAAESLSAGEGPTLPSGDRYERGLDVTRLVRISIEQFGSGEGAARLPSAAFGVLGLLIFSAVLWHLAGPWVSVWGTAFLAMYPEAVYQSRHLRFYTYQAMWGLIALYTGFQALRWAGRAREPSRRRFRTDWVWAGLTVVVLIIATGVQIVTLSILAGWLVCVGVAALADIWKRGGAAWRRSMPIQLVGIGLMSTLVLLLFRFELIGSIAARSQMVPGWARSAEGGLNPLSYYYSLSESFPVLVSFMPLIFLVAILRNPRLGTYLTIWFGIPLFLHTFVFPWKGERFILLAMPALFAAAAITAAAGAEALNRLLKVHLTKILPRRDRIRRPLAPACVGLVSLVVLVTMPAFSESRKLPGQTTSHWSRTATVISDNPELRELPIGHTWALHTLYYVGDIDFVILEDEYSMVGPVHGEDSTVGAVVLDDKVGVPILDTPAEIATRFSREGAVLIGLDPIQVPGGSVDTTLYNTLVNNAQELCRGTCGQLELYLWRFSESPDQSSVR